ncbi:MAG: adenylate kinase family protein [Thermoplasmatota archaeon]
MLVSVAGTPCVGKTSLCREMEKRGFVYRDIREIIDQNGLSEGTPEKNGEVIVDAGKLEEKLMELDLGRKVDTVLDGHLSYLAPSDICFVLRLHPEELRKRLEQRPYGRAKIEENVEAEAVSVVLVEALAKEEERLEGRPWTELPPGCGIVFEIDATGAETGPLADRAAALLDACGGKRLNELEKYRPGRIDWLEVVAGWF